MTPVEIRDALAEIANEAGPQAYASLSVATDRSESQPVYVSLYPEGITGRHCVSAHADSFANALAGLRAKWDEARALADKNSIRKMALAIIEITTDQGGCSDTALRGAGFFQQQIDRIGKPACEEATRLAAGGPFCIVATLGANSIAAE